MRVLQNIAKSGGIPTKSKKGKGGKKGKAAPTARGKRAAAVQQQPEDDDAALSDDDEIMEMAALTLDETLALKLAQATAAGDVMEIDLSSDEEEEPITTTTTSSSSSSSSVPAPFVQPKAVAIVPAMEKVSAKEISKKAIEKAAKKEKSVYDERSSDDDDDEEEDAGSDYEEGGQLEGEEYLPTRNPTEGDMILLTWAGDPVEYLCIVNTNTKIGSGLTVKSADASFPEELEFDWNVDVWKWTPGSQISAPSKKKKNPLPKYIDKKKVANKIKIQAASKPLEGLFFVITGETADLPRDQFGDTVNTMISNCGGTVRGAISGKTDYLVAGTVHYNPFLGTRGPIEVRIRVILDFSKRW